MLDVHPSHHAANTWRDFFIHIATICVGLLIAVALEQSVEYGHHRHQAHQLEEDLRAEAALNMEIIQSDLNSYRRQEKLEATVIKLAQTVPENGGFITFTIPALAPLPSGSGEDLAGTAPSHEVWSSAREVGTANLLSPQKAQLYARLDFEATEALGVGSEMSLKATDVNGMFREFSVDYDPGNVVRLTPAQRDEFVRSLSKFLELQVWYDTRLAFWQGACEAIVQHNVTSVKGLLPYTDRAAAKVQEP
jgi:hypothetical protein